MIERWYNTYATTVAGMINVTDELTREISNGKVTSGDSEIGTPGSLTDPEIFGELGESSSCMGHIKLPVPIVNIQYLYGKKPILPVLLHMDRKELDKVIYYVNYIVVEPNSSKLKYKQTLNEKEYQSADKKDAVIMTGAEAIAYMLEKEAIKDREKIILTLIPVLPLELRYIYLKKEERWTPLSTDVLYFKTVIRANRVERLAGLKAPDIIMRNEKRMLQEVVDTLVSNGARGLPVMFHDGTVMESLQECYEVITSLSRKKKTVVCPDYSERDEKILKNAVKIYQKGMNEENPDTGEIVEIPDEVVEILEEELKEVMEPICKNVIRLNFKEYQDGHGETMVNFAMVGIWKMACEYKKSDGDAFPYFTHLVYELCSCYTRKKAMFA